MKLMYLGDIHGNFNLIHQYVKMYDIKDAHIIQVGDFGVGFATFEKEKRMLEMYHTQLVNNNVDTTPANNTNFFIFLFFIYVYISILS